jgi:hypothetical protein
MKRAVIQLGRIFDGETEIPKGLLRYGRSGMKLAPWLPSIPLVIDHREGARIGRVDSLEVFREVDGDWLCARVELYKDVPAWVRKGTPASFKCVLLHESSFVDGWVHGGIVNEVSLLEREKPAEPGARVVLIYEPESKPESSRRREAPGQHRDELVPARPQILRRPGIGQVIGVR